ncbi:MAG: glycosyltransferase WbuB [Erysipelotrichia bacterium]|nr:glycosyltransferase WbuB [Erysipelotrichia bacterium]
MIAINVLVVCQYYFPEQFRINDICESLVLKGHDVTVLTGLPNYPSGHVPLEYKYFKNRNQKINGVKVKRCFEIGRKNNSFFLALNYLSFMLSSLLKVTTFKRKYDVILGYQLSPITMIFPAIKYKKKNNVPLYLYCCDLWPESIKSIIKNENNPIFKCAKWISKYVYNNSDSIGVTSNTFIKYLREVNCVDEKKIHYIPQHAEDTYLNTDFSVEDNGIVDFIFAGNVGIAQDMDCIIDACKINKDIKGFKVHIVGDGSYLQRCKQIVNEQGLENIFVFHGRHPVEEMPYFYKIADACLLTLKADNLTGLTMPSKLQGYMAAGKTVIGAINGAAQEVINESRCGLCVEASDSKALAIAMKEFISNPVKYEECGENGREYFRKYFTKDIFMEKLEEKLNSLLEDSAYV